MGNCCGLSSKSEIMQQSDCIPPEDHQEEEKRQSIEQEDELYGEHEHDEIVETATSGTTTQANTPFLATPMNEQETTKMMLPLVDPRLVSLLDFFRQLYVRRTAIFNKIIPVHRQDFETIFGQMRSVEQLDKKSSKMGGIIRQRSMSFGDVDDLKLDRFKVKPIDSGGLVPPKGDQGGGGSKPAGSK